MSSPAWSRKGSRGPSPPVGRVQWLRASGEVEERPGEAPLSAAREGAPAAVVVEWMPSTGGAPVFAGVPSVLDLWAKAGRPGAAR